MSIHPTAIVHPRADIHPSVEVGPFCVIDEHVQVAAGCRLYQNVFLTGWTMIAENCVLHPGVVVGHEPQDVKYHGERSYCRVGRGTILREYVTIHRGTGEESETLVGENCFFLGGAHVGHNCRVGNRVTLVNGSKLAGWVAVGDGANLGGDALIHQFVRIGKLAMIAANCPLAMDLPPYMLSDRHGSVAGINSVGLRRAGISSGDILEIRKAHRLLYRSGLLFREAVKRLAGRPDNPHIKLLLTFLTDPSRRGMAKGRRGRGSEADESV